MMSPVHDPYPAYARLRRERPVIAIQTIMGTQWLVTRYDDVATVLKNPGVFSSRANARGIGLVMGRTILEMEGKEHLRLRNIIAPFFRALRGGLPETIARLAHELIDHFAGDGRADLVSQFTFTFPLRVVAHIIGIPIEDYAAFHRWGLDIVGIADDPPKGFAAAAALGEYLAPVLAQRRREPTGDLLSRLAHAEVDGHHLDDEEIMGFMRLLLPAGAETTYRLIGSALFAMLQHPPVLAEVHADRAALDLVVEETLRWESPVQYVSRETVEPTALSGIDIPAGEILSIALGAANRDERHYDDPDRFDLHRHNDDHLAFGLGPHFCAGSYLARLEARIALDSLLDRLPGLRLDPRETSRVVGLAFRSPDRLPVLFDPRG
jgi:cytochrome P450